MADDKTVSKADAVLHKPHVPDKAGSECSCRTILYDRAVAAHCMSGVRDTETKQIQDSNYREVASMNQTFLKIGNGEAGRQNKLSVLMHLKGKKHMAKRKRLGLWKKAK